MPSQGTVGGQNVFKRSDQMNRQMNEMMRNIYAPGIGDFFFFMGGFGGPGGYENGFSILGGPDRHKDQHKISGCPQHQPVKSRQGPD